MKANPFWHKANSLLQLALGIYLDLSLEEICLDKEYKTTQTNTNADACMLM